jgi:hypothetical protein
MRIPRPTYANVVATLALFVALGGASYAAISLPAHSVGTVQLRDGAVTWRKLGVPIAMSSAGGGGPRVVGELLDSSCGNGPVLCSPPPPRPTPLAEVTMHLSKASKVLLLGSAEIYEPHSKAESGVSVGIGLEGGFAGSRRARLTPSNAYFDRVSFQTVILVPAGARRIGLSAEGYTAAETFASGTELVAVALPGP